jgi:H+/Cl- antiporter ClcA
MKRSEREMAGFISLRSSYASGLAGGIFAPALFIGGMLGGGFGYVDRDVMHHASSDTD